MTTDRDAGARARPWWPFALFAAASLVGLDVLDSDRGIVVAGACVVLALGALSAVIAISSYRRR